MSDDSNDRNQISRRDFAARLGAAAAGVAVGSEFFTAKSDAGPRVGNRIIGANDKVVLASIGVRGQGNGLKRGFARLPNVEQLRGFFRVGLGGPGCSRHQGRVAPFESRAAPFAGPAEFSVSRRVNGLSVVLQGPALLSQSPHNPGMPRKQRQRVDLVQAQFP